MTHEEFEKATNQFVEQAKQIMLTKGVEYSGRVDRLANFKRYSAAFGVSPLVALGLYMGKHWDSITSFINAVNANGGDLQAVEKQLSEPIETRLQDINNYVWLLHALIIDLRQQQQQHQDTQRQMAASVIGTSRLF